MNRADFQRLAMTRLDEAGALLAAGKWAGAYYLAGYAVECALKASIAKQTRAYDFPDRTTVIDSYTHDLVKLVKVAGLEQQLQSDTQADLLFAVNWATVKDWSEQSRYDLASQAAAESLNEALQDRRHGVMRWLRRHW
jgi:hypothetical protein